MTIRKGAPWGKPGLLPIEAPVVGTDRELARVVLDQRVDGRTPTIGLTGGELWRTMGGPAAVGRYKSDDAYQYSCDLGMAHFTNASGAQSVPFVAWVSARTFLWRETLAVMNAQHIGRFRFGHRSHPNDGVLDVFEARLTISEVMKVKKRAVFGAHLPHPSITERRIQNETFVFERKRRIVIDDVKYGTTSEVRIQLLADAFFVVL